MAEILNCPNCGAFFNFTGIRDVCPKCYQEEENMYQIVYRFLRKRENRAATIERIVEATGVEPDLLYKWVRKNRLHPATFPNLGYPCDNCGKLTFGAKLCDSCQNELKADLHTFEKVKEFRESVHNKRAYFTDRNK